MNDPGIKKSKNLHGKKDLDRLWMEHFAYALHKNGALDDSQYRKILVLIERELNRKYGGK